MGRDWPLQEDGRALGILRVEAGQVRCWCFDEMREENVSRSKGVGGVEGTRTEEQVASVKEDGVQTWYIRPWHIWS